MATVSIVIAVIALAGTVISVGTSTWMTLHSEEHKRLSALEKVLAKYREPLLLAAQDLHSRIYNITENHLMLYYQRPDQHDPDSTNRNDDLLRYTCFLFGQFFSWVYILRFETQFLCFVTDSRNQEFIRSLNDIAITLSTDNSFPTKFLLWSTNGLWERL